MSDALSTSTVTECMSLRAAFAHLDNLLESVDEVNSTANDITNIKNDILNAVMSIHTKWGKDSHNHAHEEGIAEGTMRHVREEFEQRRHRLKTVLGADFSCS